MLSSAPTPDINDAKNAEPSNNEVVDGSLFLPILLSACDGLGVTGEESAQILSSARDVHEDPGNKDMILKIQREESEERQGVPLFVHASSHVFTAPIPSFQQSESDGVVNAQQSLESTPEQTSNIIGGRSPQQEDRLDPEVPLSEGLFETQSGRSYGQFFGADARQMPLVMGFVPGIANNSETLEIAQSAKGESLLAPIQARTAINPEELHFGPSAISVDPVDGRVLTAVQGTESVQFHESERLTEGIRFLGQIGSPLQDMREVRMPTTLVRSDITSRESEAVEAVLTSIPQAATSVTEGEGQEASAFASQSQEEMRGDVNAVRGRGLEIVAREKESSTGLGPRATYVSKIGEKGVDVPQVPGSEQASINTIAVKDGNLEGKESEASQTLAQGELLVPAGKQAASKSIEDAQTGKPILSSSESNNRAGLEREIEDGKSAGDIGMESQAKESITNEQIHSRVKKSKSFETPVDKNESFTSIEEGGEHVAQTKSAIDPAAGGLMGRIQSDSARHQASVSKSEALAAGKPESESSLAGRNLSNPFSDLTRDVVRQLVKGFSLQVGEKASEMRLALKPPSLGNVTLRVRMDEGKMAAQIEVNHDGTRAVLEASLPRLRDGLASRGIEVDRIDVFMAGQAFSRESDGQNAARLRSASGGKPRMASDAAEPYRSVKLLGYNTIEYIM